MLPGESPRWASFNSNDERVSYCRPVAFVFRDLTASCLDWLFMDSPSESFRKWATVQEPEVKAGLAALGLFGQWNEATAGAEVVARHRDRLRQFVRRDAWRSAIEEGTRAAALTLNQVGPDVRVYALIGAARSNGSAAWWDGRGLAFIWLENWLGPGATGELQDLSLDSLPVSVSHELAHAIRYGLPATHSAVPRLTAVDPARVLQPWSHIPLRELMYDEGLATRFSIDAFPRTSLAEALLMTPEQVAWLDGQWPRLLADRVRRWDFDVPPSMDTLVDALAYVPERLKGPWTFERPPTKWAYT